MKNTPKYKIVKLHSNPNRPMYRAYVKLFGVWWFRTGIDRFRETSCLEEIMVYVLTTSSTSARDVTGERPDLMFIGFRNRFGKDRKFCLSADGAEAMTALGNDEFPHKSEWRLVVPNNRGGEA